MDGRRVVIALIAFAAGLAVGFLFANSINRSELSTLRAENDRMRSEKASVSTGDAKPSLTGEEIAATIARAEQNSGDLQIQRSHGIALYRYAAIKQDAQLLQQSVEILQRAAALAPDDYDVIVTLGNANFDIGYFGKNNEALVSAREFYAKALAIKPSDVDVRTDVGLTYYLQTPPDLERSIGEFRKSLSTNPKHEKTLRFIIEALIKQNKSAEAGEFFERLKAVNPRNESIPELTSMLAQSQAAG